MRLDLHNNEGCQAVGVAYGPPEEYDEFTHPGNVTVTLICGDRRLDLESRHLGYRDANQKKFSSLGAAVLEGFCTNCPNFLPAS